MQHSQRYKGFLVAWIGLMVCTSVVFAGPSDATKVPKYAPSSASAGSTASVSVLHYSVGPGGSNVQCPTGGVLEDFKIVPYTSGTGSWSGGAGTQWTNSRYHPIACSAGTAVQRRFPWRVRIIKACYLRKTMRLIHGLLVPGIRRILMPQVFNVRLLCQLRLSSDSVGMIPPDAITQSPIAWIYFNDVTVDINGWGYATSNAANNDWYTQYNNDATDIASVAWAASTSATPPKTFSATVQVALYGTNNNSYGGSASSAGALYTYNIMYICNTPTNIAYPFTGTTRYTTLTLDNSAWGKTCVLSCNGWVYSATQPAWVGSKMSMQCY